jgi:uncharacterized protein (DUF1684 family)
MRSAVLAYCVLTVLAATAASAATPAEQWKREIAKGNVAFAMRPHAILKIQDAAYLGEGEIATLKGTPGKPETYKWTAGKAPNGVLTATVRDHHPVIIKDGKTYTEAEVTKGIPVVPDVDVTGAQTQVDAGVLGARFFVFNQKAAAAKNFKGVEFFPYDPAYRVAAAFKPDPKLPPRTFRTSRGTDKQFFHAGDASFTLQGKPFTLPLYADNNDPKKISSMSAFFTDNLTGKGAYGAGRYVDAEDFGAFPPKKITIDFNFAYNPNCARSPFFTCPVATDNLALAMKVGERDPHAAH